MPNPLFSTYRQGENRVTSTIVAVLEHINNRLAEDILEAVIDESALSLVSFENQVTGVDSVPDAAIRSSTALWFETKTSPDAVNQDQLKNHLEALDAGDAELQRLIVLTPDARRPNEVAALNDERVAWTNFDSLVDSIESILERNVGNTDESMSVPTEREAFLLRELTRFIYDEDLVSGKEDRVLVVGARKAYPEFQNYGLYFCQPNRSFKPSKYLAFYADQEIKPEVPLIIDQVERMMLTPQGVDRTDLSKSKKDRLEAALQHMYDNDSERFGEAQKVMFLDEGYELDEPIENDKTASDSDRTVGFVQGHRYVSFSKLQENPAYTTELEE